MRDFYLIRAPKLLSLYEIMAATEDTMQFNCCLKDVLAAPKHKVHRYLAVLQSDMEKN